MQSRHLVLAAVILATYARLATAQAAPVSQAPPPPPATKLEAFKPAAGSVLTFGYNELGDIAGVSVDARELKDAKGNVVRGVVVQVTQSQYREERAFVDADELAELLKGIDAILEVKANPTSFQNFEVRYTTKGGLQITAFSGNGGAIRYAVQTGRVLSAEAFTDQDGVRKLKAMFESAIQLLSPTPGK